MKEKKIFDMSTQEGKFLNDVVDRFIIPLANHAICHDRNPLDIIALCNDAKKVMKKFCGKQI